MRNTSAPNTGIFSQTSWRPSGCLPFRLLAFLILILLTVAFQAPLPAWSAETISIYKHGSASDRQLDVLVQLLKQGGYHYRIIEEKSLGALAPEPGDYLLMPMGRRLSDEDVAALLQYSERGGKVLIFPGRAGGSRLAAELMYGLGLPIEGMQQIARELTVHWLDGSEFSGEKLAYDSPVLLFDVQAGQQMLANFSKHHPAVITSGKGAVINWPVEAEHLKGSTAHALSVILGAPAPPTLLDRSPVPAEKHVSADDEEPVVQGAPVASLQASTPAEVAAAPDTTSVEETDDNVVEAPIEAAQPEPVSEEVPSGRETLAEAPREPKAAPTVELAKDVELSQATPVVVAQPEPVVQQAPATEIALASPTTAEALNAAPPQLEAAATPETVAEPVAEEPRNLNKSLTDADNESVFTDIGDDKEAEIEMVDDPVTSGPERQKTVSFLGGGTGYNDFDYGEYYQKMQAISNLRQRVEHGLELASLFKSDVPEDAILDLLLKASRSKSRFETLFLAGKTAEAQQAFSEAQNQLVQAIGLSSPAQRVEGRAIWLDRGTIVASGSPEGLRQRLKKLQKAGINIVYFETLNAGFPIYPSRLLPGNPLISGWDPLAVAVEEGHKLGMEVHAWVWCFAVGNMRHNVLINKPDTYSGPVLNEAGLMSEALRNASGGLSVDSRQHEFWLSPASPKARQFLISVYKEIVSNYDVDGVQLDYIRYPFQGYRSQMGFEPVGREKFRLSTGLPLDKLDDSGRKMWIAWKTYQINSFVQEVSQTLKGMKPDLKLSAAVFPLTRANRILAIQQDWETWVENGWIDTLSPMSYTASPQRLQRIFDYVSTATQKRTIIYPGIAMNKLDPVQLVMQLEALRDVGSLGNTLFAMAHFNDEKAGILGEGPYKMAQPISPHRDPLGGLEVVLSDYEEKYDRIRQQGQGSVPDNSDPLIRQGLIELHQGLALVRNEARRGVISTSLLQGVQANLQSLQAATQLWQDSEPESKAYRSQYFGRLVVMMQQLADYLSDQPALYQANPLRGSN